jgi:hypothetical protein
LILGHAVSKGAAQCHEKTTCNTAPVISRIQPVAICNRSEESASGVIVRRRAEGKGTPCR